MRICLKARYLSKSKVIESMTKEWKIDNFAFFFEHVLCELFDIKEIINQSFLLDLIKSYDRIKDENLGFSIFDNKVELIDLDEILLTNFVKQNLEFALNFFKSRLKKEDFTKLLRAKNKNGENLLNINTCKNESYNFTLNYVINKLSSHDLKEILSECNKFGMLPLHYATLRHNEETFKLCLATYRDLLTKEEFKSLLLQRTKTFNALHLAAKNSNFNSLEILLDLIEKICGIEELKDMLSECDEGERNLPLHLAIRNESENIEEIEFLVSIYEKLFTSAEIGEFLKLKLRIKNLSLDIFELSKKDEISTSKKPKILENFLFSL